MTGLLQHAGAQPQKQPRYTPVHSARAQAGLITNRAALHDPSIGIYSSFWGGQPDCLFDGLNVEISPQMTWLRRPGTSLFGVSSSIYPSAPLTTFSYYNSDGSISLYVDTVTGVYLHNALGAPTLIFTKSAGAGQTSFLQLGSVLYFANGVDSKKLINGTIYNWASAGPTAAPSCTVDSIGAGAAAGVSWSASTVFTTMGLLKDPNGNTQQLISVNADGTNSTSTLIGTSGIGEPNWSNTSSATVTEVSGLVWTCYGPVGTWQPNSTYTYAKVAAGTAAAPCCIYDPGTGNIFIFDTNSGGSTGQSGTTRPNFASVPLAGHCQDAHGYKWFNMGPANLWKPSTSYVHFPSSGVNSFVVEPTTPAAAGYGTANQQTVYIQVTLSAGTSDSSHTGPAWSSSLTNPVTRDGQLNYQYLGSATWASNHTYTAWQAGNPQFSALYDGANFQVCITGGTSGGSPPTWQTGYGQITVDNTVSWVCVGASMSWAASTKWFLPAGGFAPPVKGVNPYGGASIVDSNKNVQFVTNSGLSGGSAPSWASAVGSTTTDSGVTWTLTALAANFPNGKALAFTAGYGYCYAFKSRTAADYYVTNAPNGSTNALGAPTGSGTGGITTASPTFQMPTGANTGAIMQLSGAWPTDLQYDTVVVYRSTDGTQGGPYLELTEIPCPQPVNGVYPGTWSFYDSLPDVELNINIQADIIGQNTPPPTGITNLAFHMNRVFGNVGSILYASSGPDIPPDNGNGFEGWAPINNFPLKSPINKNIATQSGLLAFTTSDVYILAGGPDVSQYFPWPLAKGIGLLNPNAIEMIGGEIYMFTADRRFIAYQPGAGHTEIGFYIADKLALLDPTKVYVTEHAAGNDISSFYVGDGTTGWYRLTPHASPGFMSSEQPVWSPKASITGGCQMVKSAQTSPGVRTLLIGKTGSGTLLQRDLTKNTDSGTFYSGFFVIGSIVLTHPGQLAEMGFITMEFANQGDPVVKYRLNEISDAADWMEFGTWVYDPPLVYGTTLSPASYSPRRYDFQQTVRDTGEPPPPLLARHMQLRVDFGAEDARHELFTFTVNAALFAEA